MSCRLVSHARDESVLEPFRYLSQIPGKDVRGTLIDCFQQWLQIPGEKMIAIKEIIASLHNASLLVDDIEDNSKLRRGVPVAHSIYGVAMTINCANYVYFLALEKCQALNCPRAMEIFVQELLNLHRGQGQDILWREECKCPTGTS
jgi:geranylgeranyl diphosphate synthase type 3